MKENNYEIPPRIAIPFPSYWSTYQKEGLHFILDGIYFPQNKNFEIDPEGLILIFEKAFHSDWNKLFFVLKQRDYPSNYEGKLPDFVNYELYSWAAMAAFSALQYSRILLRKLELIEKDNLKEIDFEILKHLRNFSKINHYKFIGSFRKKNPILINQNVSLRPPGVPKISKSLSRLAKGGYIKYEKEDPKVAKKGKGRPSKFILLTEKGEKSVSFTLKGKISITDDEHQRLSYSSFDNEDILPTRILLDAFRQENGIKNENLENEIETHIEKLSEESNKSEFMSNKEKRLSKEENRALSHALLLEAGNTPKEQKKIDNSLKEQGINPDKLRRILRRIHRKREKWEKEWKLKH